MIAKPHKNAKLQRIAYPKNRFMKKKIEKILDQFVDYYVSFFKVGSNSIISDAVRKPN